MPKVQRMFLDNLIENFLQVCKSHGTSPDSTPLPLLQEAHLFLINSAVVSDLYEIPFEKTNYEAGLHLPFKTIFFEFMESIPISVQGIDKRLKGIVAANSDREDINEKVLDSNHYFQMVLYYEDSVNKNRPNKFCHPLSKSKKPGMDQDVILFEFATLPAFELSINQDLYKCNPTTGISYVGPAIPMPLNMRYVPHSNISSYEDYKDYEKIRNLCINIIEYINAHNVIIKKEEGNIKELEKVNRKRRNKGKAPLPEVRPYYWIELKEEIITKSEKEDNVNNVGEGSAMTHREWVRGHFIRYHYKIEGQDVVKRLWRQPFVRGPAGAPWKEKRYEVLDDLLRKGPRYQSFE